MLASAFPNAPVSPSNTSSDSKTRTKIAVEGKRERYCEENNGIDLEVKDCVGSPRKDRSPLNRSTSLGCIGVETDLDPFDFILMDIQMPVMGKKNALFHCLLVCSATFVKPER